LEKKEKTVRVAFDGNVMPYKELPILESDRMVLGEVGMSTASHL
jgi:hypothetical protein